MLLIVYLLIPIALGVFIYARVVEKKNSEIIKDFVKRNQQLRDRIYELSILQEVSKSISYSLNIEKVADIITSSLSDIIDFDVACYTVFSNSVITHKSYIKTPVSSAYIQQLQKVSVEHFSQKRKINLKKSTFSDSITGAVLDNSSNLVPLSITHVPLRLNKRIVGLVTLTSINKNTYKNDYRIGLIENISSQAMHAVENLQKLLILEKGKLSTMVESLADGVFFIDEKMKLLVTNNSGKRMLGLYREDITITDLFLKLDSINIKDKYDQALKLKKSFIIPDVQVRGKYLKVLISQVPGQKEALGVVVLIQDVTHQKELEKMREDFTSMMVHDLRAPLTVMSGSSDILIKRDADLSKEQKTELLFAIKKGAYSLLEIVNDLLDVAKMEHGKFTVNKEVQDISNFIKSKSEYFRSLIEERGITYTIKVPNEKILVDFDENLISRVISNLLSNANKYTAQGHIEISLETDTKSVVVKVIDTGVGISKENQKHLFNKFEQIRNPVDAKQKGTGLGLVITKNIVKEHGGDIGIISKEGEGSTFWFTLPIFKQSKLKV